MLILILEWDSSVTLEKGNISHDNESFGWLVSSLQFHGTLVQSLLVSAHSSLRVLVFFTSVC